MIELLEACYRFNCDLDRIIDKEEDVAKIALFKTFQSTFHSFLEVFRKISKTEHEKERL